MLIETYPLVPGRQVTLAGAPEGVDALLLGELAQGAGETLLHVAQDEARMVHLSEAVAFFAPGVEVISLPSWDCLPYDRVPPRTDVMARRIAALVALMIPATGPRLVVTTVSAILQRVPPRAAIAGAAFAARVGERLDIAALTAFLAANGYSRADTVREPGEFALRGGIVDVYPPGADDPVRLDLLGDDLEGVRSFDPMTQRSAGTRDGLLLLPASEVLVDEAATERFRATYRRTFGAVRTGDALYEAVSAGMRHPGMEHWLPLFYERLETLFDYVDGAVTLDPQAEEAVAARLELIADYHRAREEARAKHGKGDDQALVYNPLPPEVLYLAAAEWAATLGRRAVGELTPFAVPASRDTVALGARRVEDFAAARARPDVNLFDAVRTRLGDERRGGARIVVAAYSIGSRERLGHLLDEHGAGPLAAAESWVAALALPAGTLGLVVLGLNSGFAMPGVTVYTEQDILGDRLTRRPRRTRRADDFIAEVSTLNLGDLVVHADHGIGRYDGLVTLEIAGAPHDCLRLIYAGDDRLFLPVENIERLSRYGSEDSGAQLDRLGGVVWQARKARAKERIGLVAAELMKIAAARELRRAAQITPPTGIYDEFAARFPFEETEDQQRAIEDTLADLAAGRSMDRLVCGDVGFGKTEVALRAAFVAAMSGRQVAVVVPTTLLARQHYKTFVDRFAGYPLKIAQLSRLVTGKDSAAVRVGLADGQIDIVVGTHTLLSKSIGFRDLGLLVVDEEQHFGVVQKERLKALRADVHVLTLTATPIPRTMQLALAGVRELSLIATPPVDRLAVRTFVMPWDPVIVREAIMRERFRGGQTFYVCPRIEDLPDITERLRKLVPEVRMAVAHGRMPASELERVIGAFYDGEFDVLVSTNIVESGLDIPAANTIVIHRADMFGLSQLYQLRGRVGRAKIRAYAYLTLPPGRHLGASALNRLDVMQTLDSLGAGFSLASHDLDIRGAGNLLGEEQSGHIREVGVELYQQMLEDAVNAAREDGEGEAPVEDWSPTITIGTSVLIPEDYVADLPLRMGLYRRIARVVDLAEIEGLAAEMIDRFGKMPPEVDNLLAIVGLKRLCRDVGVEKLDAGPKGAVVAFRENAFANPAGLVDLITAANGRVKLRPDHRLVYASDWSDPAKRLVGARRLVERLASIARAPAARAAQ